MKSLLQPTCLVALATLAACASPPPPPAHSERGGALPLTTESHLDELDCAQDNCVHWYRVSVPGKGRLRALVETLEPPAKERKSGFFSKKVKDSGPPHFEVALVDGSGESIASHESDGKAERAVEVDVAKGQYLVSIRSAIPGIPFSYRVTSGFEPAPRPRPQPRKPRFEARSATILEAEGWGTDVEALLIDLGSTHGVRPGLTGRLIDSGKTIGAIVIEQVYPDGSRASIEGTLSRPLGPESRAVVMVPVK